MKEKLRNFLHPQISLLNGQIDYEELEHDEVFRREIAASDFYIECKEDYIQLSRDNGDINADLEQVIENEEKNFEMLQNTRKDVEALEADVASLLAERNDLDRDRKDLQIDIQARQLKAQAAEKSLSNEITALTAELDRETTELEIEEKSFLETIAKLNLKLKHEQSKTRRAKQQQQSAKAEMELHRSSSQPLSLLEPSKMPFSQQEKAPLLKRRYQDREINAPIKPESPIKRRSLTKLSPISTLDPRSSSNKEAPMVKVPANRFSTTKENQYPVYLNDQDDEAAKRHEQAEEEKAFDSDETSVSSRIFVQCFLLLKNRFMVSDEHHIQHRHRRSFDFLKFASSFFFHQNILRFSMPHFTQFIFNFKQKAR